MSRETEELIEPVTGAALALTVVAIAWALAPHVLYVASLALLLVGPVAWPALTQHWRSNR
jgi:hypothetical protein